MKKTAILLSLVLMCLLCMVALGDSNRNVPLKSPIKGPVLLLHGSRNGTVPLWCSEKFLETYGTPAQLQVIKGENHTITRHRKVVVTRTVEFFQKVFGL